MDKAEMEEAVKWPSGLLKQGKRRGLEPPNRDIDYIYKLIGDTTPDEDHFLISQLPGSVYSDYGIIIGVHDLRTARYLRAKWARKYNFRNDTPLTAQG